MIRKFLPTISLGTLITFISLCITPFYAYSKTNNKVEQAYLSTSQGAADARCKRMGGDRAMEIQNGRVPMGKKRYQCLKRKSKSEIDQIAFAECRKKAPNKKVVDYKIVNEFKRSAKIECYAEGEKAKKEEALRKGKEICNKAGHLFTGKFEKNGDAICLKRDEERLAKEGEKRCNAIHKSFDRAVWDFKNNKAGVKCKNASNKTFTLRSGYRAESESAAEKVCVNIGGNSVTLISKIKGNLKWTCKKKPQSEIKSRMSDGSEILWIGSAVSGGVGVLVGLQVLISMGALAGLVTGGFFAVVAVVFLLLWGIVKLIQHLTRIDDDFNYRYGIYSVIKKEDSTV